MEIYNVSTAIAATALSFVNYPRNVTATGVLRGIEKQGRIFFAQICQLTKEKLSNILPAL